MAEISLKDALHSEEDVPKNKIELNITYTIFERLMNFLC